MKQPVKSAVVPLKILALVMALAVVAQAGLPYLPQVGPPPLRLQPAAGSNTAAFKLAWAATSTAKAGTATNTAVFIGVAATNGFPSLTNSMGGQTAIVAVVATNSPSESASEMFTGSIFALPTPDLLAITPQMLATYFHPVQFGANLGVAVPLPVSFLPPLPVAKSSRAEYILK
ncbi:MAG TPA: hypothetical protein VF988_06875 [Verrucomicrobiae bacterium]